MKRRKTFQHPDQLELGLLFEAGDAAATVSPAAEVRRACAAAPAAAELHMEDRPQKRRRKRGAPAENEPEFAQLHEAGWQAQAPQSLFEQAEAETATPGNDSSGSYALSAPSEPSLPDESFESADSAAPPESSESGMREPRLWSDESWTVRVVTHEAGSGWAAEIHKNGESEPALVCPWEVDREKNPRPLDAPAFDSLVKTAVDMRRRQERQLQAMLHKSVTVQTRSAVITVTLDIVPDEDDSHAVLAAADESGTQLAEVRVAPGFKLSQRVASAWVDSGYRKVERF